MEILNFNSKYSNVSTALLFESVANKDVLVSIIIPTYKRFDLLREAIKSAINQKNKHLLSYEIIVVDNDANNLNNCKLESLLDLNYKDLNFRYYVNSENIGMMANWNRGIELARGQWIIQLHDDDYFLPHFIETIFKDIQRFSDVDAIVHSTIFHDKRKDSKLEIYSTRKKIYFKLTPYHVVGGNYHISGALIKKDVLFKLGGFNAEMYPISDYDFNERLIRNFTAIYIYNEPLAVIVFEENETLNTKNFENWFALERKIKNNAICHFNGGLRLILSKIIDVQINSEIDYYVKEIFINNDDKEYIKSKKLPVNTLSKIMWITFGRYIQIMNLVNRKKY